MLLSSQGRVAIALVRPHEGTRLCPPPPGAADVGQQQQQQQRGARRAAGTPAATRAHQVRPQAGALRCLAAHLGGSPRGPRHVAGAAAEAGQPAVQASPALREEPPPRLAPTAIVAGVLAASMALCPVSPCMASQAQAGFGGMPGFGGTAARAASDLKRRPWSPALVLMSAAPAPAAASSATQPSSSTTLPSSSATLPSSSATPPNSSAATPSEAYCDADRLVIVFQQLARGDGFDIGASPLGLYQFYRRLGCTDEQLTAALATAFDTLPGTGAVAGDGAQKGVPFVLAPLLSSPDPKVFAAELAIAATLFLLLGIYKQRPRGWARRDLLQLAPSAVAGTGLFARVDIPEDTVLGCYPGRPRSAADMAAKAEAAPGVAEYVFNTGHGLYMDPTDAQGACPSPYPAPGPWWPLEIQTDLAYVNEPPAGSGGTNCSVKDGDDEAELLFVTSRAISAGEEVLIDYGSTYNRSSYGQR